MNGNPWTPERIERLKDLAVKGEVGAVIAAELGMTRNAVIGKIHRLKLTWIGASERLKAGRTKGTPNGYRKRTRVNRYKLMRPPTLAPAVPLVAHGDPKRRRKRCTLLGLKADSCRFPLGDHEPRSKKFRFCGDKAVKGYSYCADHCHIAYRQRNAA